jgi:CheY-like chemotaxis protein
MGNINLEDMTILLAEDAEIQRDILVDNLNDLGFHNIISAKDGKQAFSELKKNKMVDLIISDWSMPEMDGLELFKTVKKEDEFKDIPFVLLTVQSDKSKVVEALQEGITDYLLKPVPLGDLQKKVRSLLTKARASHKRRGWAQS